ncbi:MAG: P-type conjugative transfer protein TrbL [Phenylobacterium sp.]|uniref:P-type conjugative transfer protein TrbL n=1 Tax=Phenylobacterium sp. TaxID=1871053 RepID=UPI002736342B|nr:P-type conjugative transfer protein TrbL [Phenylobacterium sp.]MDP3746667.1 P-type conjugative transfer protein TrbL [Phenylobacterium sp.]
MDNVNVIDRFTNTFAGYIDSGFGLVDGEVSSLAATLIAIDMTLAGLFWALGGADDVIARLIKKVLYVGAFAFIIGNFNALAGIIFRSFAGLGLQASGGTISEADLLQPGRLAAVGVEAGRPFYEAIGQLAGFPDVFANLDTIAVLILAFLVVVLSFFILAVQVFVAIIEFKLTTLAGFVLVPFALWTKTSFLAEKVLGNVMASGVKILVLAVIVGIGTGLFAEFKAPAGTEPTFDQALALILASITFLGLGIFGPAIAGGLISGAPQLGAGAAVGATAAAAGLVVAGGAGAMAAGRLAGGGVAAATRLSASARGAYAAGAAGRTGVSGVAGGLAGVARAGAAAAKGGGQGADTAPAWAAKLKRDQTWRHAASGAAHALRAGDHGGSGAAPTLRDPET